MGYDAFISYSHAADGLLAPALHDGLQRFAKKWNRRRALRVFRDDSGLSVTPALWPAIEAALDTSQYFILLASPDASSSEWVNREVGRWSELGRADRILPVVTAGEWVWDSAAGDFDWSRSSAVPPALRGAFTEEPRHLDLRWVKSAVPTEKLDLRNSQFRSAIADIAAPIHGQDKDELEGQDLREFRKARRYRRLATAALAILAVALGVAAVAAFSSAKEARRQEQAAIEQAQIADEKTREAESALAVSEARRLLLSSQVATTQRDAIQLAREARERAVVAGADVTSFDDGLFAALSRDDLPLATFSGLNEPDSYSGGNRGLSFAPDGSSFAYVGTDAAVHVIRAWDLGERHVIRLDDILTERAGASPFVQTSFANGGGRLAVVTGTEIVLVELGNDPSVVERSHIGTVGPPLAVAVSADDRLVGVLDGNMTFTVFEISSGAVAGRFGEERLVTDADLVQIAISADQNRMCAVGGGVMRHVQIDPPMLIGDLDASVTDVSACWPEGCGGRVEAVLAKRSDGGGAAEGGLLCLDEQGTVVADHGLAADYSGQRGFANLALSSLNQDGTFLVDLGYGVSVPALPDDLTLTNAVFTIPERLRTSPATSSRAVPQEWFAARVLQHQSGPFLVDYLADGSIQVWRLARGFLPLLQSVETEPPELGSGSLVLPPDGSEEAPTAYFEDFADGPEFAAISAFPSGEPTVKIPRTAEPRLVAATSQSTYLVVMADGSAFSVDLSEGGSYADLDLAGISGDTVAAYRHGMLAMGSEAGVALFSVEASSTQPTKVLETGSYAALVCEVGVSANARALGVVLCPEDRPGEVLSIDVETGDTILAPTPLRYSFPSTVSVSDDGNTIAVAFISGEIGVRVGEAWVEPASLSLGKPEHNDFNSGWASVDPSGEFMITRRDRDGVEIWRVGSPEDGPLAALRLEDWWAPPDRVVFEEDAVSISWSNLRSAGYRRQTWPLSHERLDEVACVLVGATATRSEPSCADVRIGHAEAVSAMPEPAPTAQPGVATAAATNITTWPLAEELAPEHMTLDADGSVWTAGSHGLGILDQNGSVVVHPWSNFSPNGIVSRDDGTVIIAAWFSTVIADRTGFLGQWEFDGSTLGVVLAGQDAFVMSDRGAVHRIVGDRMDLYLPLGDIWADATFGAIRASPRADEFVVSLTDGEGVGHLVTIDATDRSDTTDVVLPDGVAASNFELDGQGRVWFLTPDREQVGVLADGSPVVLYDLPPSFRASAITTSQGHDGIWVAGRNGFLRIADGSVGGVVAVPNSGWIVSVIEDRDGSIWLADRDRDAVFHVEFAAGA